MTVFDQQWWEERYRSATAAGHVNAPLAAVAADLPPGRALEAGCGQGGDALWLAERGWDVLGVDISTVAVDRARAEAERRGLTGRARFEQADLTTWTPEDRYDLVTASYVHPATADRAAFWSRLAAHVATGGTLLLVQHDHRDETADRRDLPGATATADELFAHLDPAQWDVVTATARPRRAGHHGHGEATALDAVLVARRR